MICKNCGIDTSTVICENCGINVVWYNKYGVNKTLLNDENDDLDADFESESVDNNGNIDKDKRFIDKIKEIFIPDGSGD
jgi:hypothetical protein